MDKDNIMHQDTVALDPQTEELVILDQTRLPGQTVFLRLSTAEAIYQAISTLQVRGAPAIGVAAAIGIYAVCRRMPETDYETFAAEFERIRAYLVSARPTAVNLAWALEQMAQVVREHAGCPVAALKDRLRERALELRDQDIQVCRAIGEYGLTLIQNGDGILTHCNAGELAASRYGTALGPILLGQERGKKLRVCADETRPLLQGARLTAWELARAGVEVTLICDNMASMVMKNGWVQACFVGCDRVAANGDTANKIGTSGLAVLARYYNVPFYVLGPTSTIDLDCPTGADIPIEERDGEEIRSLWYREPMAPAEVRCWDPAFDVTDHSLISAIVTEGGICRPPFGESLRELVSREKGDAP